VVFHNLSGYDSHLFIKNLGGNIDCIPTNEEKYISFTKSIEIDSYMDKKGEIKPIIKQLRFIHSFKFMASSLYKLVSNITTCGKCDACKPGSCLKRSVEERNIVYHNTIGPLGDV